MMEPTPIAVVGLGAIMPSAPNVGAFWQNICGGRYCIDEVDPDRWDPALYYDPDPRAPERTYSKIGGWVRDWEWDPLGWHLPIPPRVSEAMDDAQKWAVACTRMALADYGWPKRPLDLERTGIIIGNALSGEKHYLTALRLTFPELARELDRAPSYAALEPRQRAAITEELRGNLDAWLPPVTEDTMPGELGNCIAGRVANLFNLRGPSFVTDAACASALAALDAAAEALSDGECDVAITGGIDRNMGASTFIKFCAIGALSATGTRPYRDGADGFVMGEGAGLMVLKRLQDAERDGDRIYAVVRGVAGSSDGKGKGITAPNPVGQRLAIERAWQSAGLSPADCSLIEGHGTSTRVGDLVEVTSLAEAFAGEQLPPGSIALGSVKSNIGHLKGAAGAAGLIKAILALHHKQLPPSIGEEPPNPNIDWAGLPFAVNTALREWELPNGAKPGPRTRVAGVSAFGFGGTNFHAVLEEHVPGRFSRDGHASAAVPAAVEPAAAHVAGVSGAESGPARAADQTPGRRGEVKAPLRGALVIGAADTAALRTRLQRVLADANTGHAPEPGAPAERDLQAPERLALDYGDAGELAVKAAAALKALDHDSPAAWSALRGRGIFRGSGASGKVAFLYTGQGSQYANMLAQLCRIEPVVAETFAEADRVMRPLLDGRALSSIVFVDPQDPAAAAAAEAELMKTEITQPAVLTADVALTRLLAEYGVAPDLVMGHSLGEYGALVAAGVLPFDEALEAVSARGSEMAHLDAPDRGAMAAVSAPLAEVQEIVARADGYVVLANVNSSKQIVLGGATDAVERAVAMVQERGYQAMRLPVSHAFHTAIVSAASEPLRTMLRRLHLSPPQIPIVANVDGELYPMGAGVEEQIIDILGRQVAEPVQFIKGLHTLHAQGAKVLVETGPKRALWGFAADVLGDAVLPLYTNHPKVGDVVSFNQALCGLYASGLGAGHALAASSDVGTGSSTPSGNGTAATDPPPTLGADTRRELERVVADVIERGLRLAGGASKPVGASEPVVITGAALGTPGTARVFDDANLAALLRGEQLIDVIPSATRRAIVDHHITRLVKDEHGGGRFEAIDGARDVIKLAAQAGQLDLAREFGVDPERVAALGRSTQLAIAAGIDALRDAGIPLVLHYKTTTRGTQLPDRWMIPADLRDDTGVIFASAFPGLEEFAEEAETFWADRALHERLAELQALRERLSRHVDEVALAEIDRVVHEAALQVERRAYRFDRRFLFRVLSMGHSQFAELIGARGPNTQVNAACASTTQAVALAEDWIRAGRCRRVVVIAADDATSPRLMPWIGSGFLASGAAATDEDVAEAALPFDRRRHGLIIGMGAAALVVESAAAVADRGIAPICEVLGAVTANSAFHGTRLDVEHICGVMEDVVRQAEARGVTRAEIAPETLFVSHETYTPARGGSASAEIHALRRVFGEQAGRIVIANTKGLTGHPMGVGIEDVVAVKSLETGIVPPVPNFQQVDPELGELNLSRGGAYPVRYALRLAAGFGSQISMALLRWTPAPDGRRRHPEELGFAYRVVDTDRWESWLSRVSGQASPALEVVQHRLRVADSHQARETEGSPSAAPPRTAPAELAEPAAAPREKPRPAGAAGAPVPAAAGPEPPATAGPRVASAVAPEPEAESPSGSGGAAVVLEEILGLVAEQTGYPVDMLDPDLDLEADLGIDTVKQAEMFSQVRERFGIERDDSLKLRDYPTLRHVAGFVTERSGGGTSAQPAAVAGPVRTPVPDADPRFPRRVVAPILRPPLECCVESGVELGSHSRVVVMPDRRGCAGALQQRLHEAGVQTLTIEGDPTVQDLEDQIAAWTAEGAVQGVYWLAALDDEGDLSQLQPSAWRTAIHRRVKLLAAALRALPEVGSTGSFLMSATSLGGRLGAGHEGATAPMGGAVSGFTKALARERPDALIKVVDFAAATPPERCAELLVEETLRDPGVLEVGHCDQLRWSVGLLEQPAELDAARTLRPTSVFVITGAAGSIVSAITADLASAAGGGVFHLLDLVPAPDRRDPDLARFASDRDGLKLELADRLRERGERPTPKLVERELARIERARAALDAIEAIERTGGVAHWHSVDLADADAVAAAIAEVGPQVDVLLHCAGVEISHFLPDKPQREYDLVFDVKADGWYHLLRALRGRSLGAAVVFSSIAGRFGNAGQTDYSAANDLLCKSISTVRRTSPQTHAVAIDWTAWAGIGMASRGSIPKMMEMAGIDMLPAEIGVPAVRRELTAAGAGGEVLIAGSLGVLRAERHETGGLDPVKVAGQSTAGPMAGRIEAMTLWEGLRVTTLLDPARQPFLYDHRIDGTAVLPGVMGMEAFAEAALALLPDWHVTAIEDVELRAPFKFYRDEPRQLQVDAQLCDGGDGTLVAECRLVGRRHVAGGEQETTHFTGRVRLARKALEPPTGRSVPEPERATIDHDTVYEVYFHGPAFQVLDRAYRHDGLVVGRLADDLPPDHEPPSSPTTMAPRLIELCFQTAGVWELGTTAQMGLPTHVDRVLRFDGADDPGPLWALVTPRDGGIDADVVDASGRVRVRLEGYRTTALPGAVDERALAPIRAGVEG